MAKEMKSVHKLEKSFAFIDAATNEKLNQLYDTASDYLFLSDFAECIETCKRGIELAKKQKDSRASRQLYIDSFTTLAIQAWGELDQREVIPFVLDIYGSDLRNLPASVLLIVITLYCQIQQYSQIEPLTRTWIQRNTKHPQYRKIIDEFVFNILLPQNRSHLVSNFLQSCFPLSSEERQEILDKVQAETSSNDQTLEKEFCFGLEGEPQTDGGERNGAAGSVVSANTGSLTWVFSIFSRVVKYFSQKVVLFSFKSVYKLAFVASCVYMIAVGVMPGTASVSWNFMPKIFRAFSRVMFKMKKP